MRILYGEDNMANVSLIQRIANLGKHDVYHFTDGQEIVNAFDRIKPDLVLMDVQLHGGLDGLEVVRILRERGSTIPMIALTAYAMVGDKERCIAAGCDGYLAKPLDVAQLVDLFDQYSADQSAAD